MKILLLSCCALLIFGCTAQLGGNYQQFCQMERHVGQIVILEQVPCYAGAPDITVIQRKQPSQTVSRNKKGNIVLGAYYENSKR